MCVCVWGGGGGGRERQGRRDIKFFLDVHILGPFSLLSFKTLLLFRGKFDTLIPGKPDSADSRCTGYQSAPRVWVKSFLN